MRFFIHSFYILVLIVLAGCSAQKRLARLLESFPELKEPETIIIKDTIYTPVHHFDTSFVYDSWIDTVTIEKDKLQVQLIRVNDTVFVNAASNPDTIYINKPFEVERIKYVTEKSKLNYNFLLIFGICLILLMLFGIFRNRGSDKK